MISKYCIAIGIPVSCVAVWWATQKYSELKEELRRLRDTCEELSSFQILKGNTFALEKERCSEDASDVAPVPLVGSHSFLPVVTNDSSPLSTKAVKLADSQPPVTKNTVKQILRVVFLFSNLAKLLMVNPPVLISWQDYLDHPALPADHLLPLATTFHRDL
ncbi:hypothetical protein QYM36_007434 [Artemia franciscana]|uniref:Uncharacterized protein n=1 Tax=Artemia franciscana TaxID=6661 RepID=A0AA88LLK0_ARTSF|nr:hypothetical protein QYM36_007434 [Artemia franciscana]